MLGLVGTKIVILERNRQKYLVSWDRKSPPIPKVVFRWDEEQPLAIGGEVVVVSKVTTTEEFRFRTYQSDVREISPTSLASFFWRRILADCPAKPFIVSQTSLGLRL